MPVLLNALRSEAATRLETNLVNAHTNPSQLDAVFALSAVGRPAVPHMVELLDENDWWLRAAAADVLGDLGTTASDTVPHLTRALDDEAEWVRRNAVEALGNIGPTAVEAVPALSHRLRDSESWIRHNAALSLAKIGPAAAEAVPALRKNIDDEDRYARANAVRGRARSAFNSRIRKRRINLGERRSNFIRPQAGVQSPPLLAAGTSPTKMVTSRSLASKIGAAAPQEMNNIRPVQAVRATLRRNIANS